MQPSPPRMGEPPQELLGAGGAAYGSRPGGQARLRAARALPQQLWIYTLAPRRGGAARPRQLWGRVTLDSVRSFVSDAGEHTACIVQQRQCTGAADDGEVVIFALSAPFAVPLPLVTCVQMLAHSVQRPDTG